MTGRSDVGRPVVLQGGKPVHGHLVKLMARYLLAAVLALVVAWAWLDALDRYRPPTLRILEHNLLEAL